jgi:hypothetical protein
MKNAQYKTTCTNGLHHGGHMMFETFRRRKEINSNINLKIVQSVALRYTITSQCTVQKEKKKV